MVEAMQSIENKSAVLVVGMKIALQNAFQNVNDRQNKISELKKPLLKLESKKYSYSVPTVLLVIILYQLFQGEK